MIRSLRSARVTGLHRYYKAVRLCAPHRYSALTASTTWATRSRDRPQATPATGQPPRGTTDSPVPCRSLSQARATFMPDGTWAVSRYPPGWSRAKIPNPVSPSSQSFRHVISGSLTLAFLAHTW